MIHIKLFSAAFILAVAAIAPAVALPVQKQHAEPRPAHRSAIGHALNLPAKPAPAYFPPNEKEFRIATSKTVIRDPKTEVLSSVESTHQKHGGGYGYAPKPRF